MQDKYQLASALRDLASKLVRYSPVSATAEIGDTGLVHDENGNRVGAWHVDGGP